MQTKTNFFCSLKLIEYAASAVTVVSSNPCIVNLPIIQIPFSSVINMHKQPYISTKYYYVSTNPLPSDNAKTSACIKSDTISKIFAFIKNSSLVSELNSCK